MCELDLMRLLDDGGDGGLYTDLWRAREAIASIPEHLDLDTRITIGQINGRSVPADEEAENELRRALGAALGLSPAETG